MSVKPYELTDAGGATCQGMITVDGYPVPNFMEDGMERGKTILGIRNWKIRDDDVVVKSLPKSGWQALLLLISLHSFDIFSILYNGKAL